MKEELTLEEISSKAEGEYLIIDVRDKTAFDYGHIEGAVNIPAEEIDGADLPKDKELYICCRSGNKSNDIAERLRAEGFKAYSLKGGYIGWLKSRILKMPKSVTAERAERSIREKFNNELYIPFEKAIEEYKLISPEDKIAVCISGGKDSFLTAKLFQEFQRQSKVPFELTFMVMDPGYSAGNREIIEKNADLLSIPVTIFETDIFDSVFNIEKSPCYICARMRRGHLYHRAQELGCNKIALGHHFDDVIETIVMGMLYGGQMQTMMPKLKSANFEGMELIRPMYLIREEHIKAWRDYNGLHFIQCACKFTETCSTCTSAESASKRQKVKELIRELAQTEPEIERNIFKSVENVNLKELIAYKDKDDIRHRFTDDY